jgi:hypothetical protein
VLPAAADERDAVLTEHAEVAARCDAVTDGALAADPGSGRP